MLSRDSAACEARLRGILRKSLLRIMKKNTYLCGTKLFIATMLLLLCAGCVTDLLYRKNVNRLAPPKSIAEEPRPQPGSTMPKETPAPPVTAEKEQESVVLPVVNKERETPLPEEPLADQKSAVFSEVDQKQKPPSSVPTEMKDETLPAETESKKKTADPPHAGKEKNDGTRGCYS